MEDLVKTPLMQKKAQDLTVGDSLQLTLVITAVTVAVPLVLGFVAAGIKSAADIYKKRKTDKSTSDTPVES